MFFHCRLPVQAAFLACEREGSQRKHTTHQVVQQAPGLHAFTSFFLASSLFDHPLPRQGGRFLLVKHMHAFLLRFVQPPPPQYTDPNIWAYAARAWGHSTSTHTRFVPLRSWLLVLRIHAPSPSNTFDAQKAHQLSATASGVLSGRHR